MVETFEYILFYGLRVFSSVFEILFAFLLMEGFFKYKFRSKLPKFSAFIISTALILVLQETGNLGEIKALVEVILVFAVSMLIYDGKFKIKIACNAAFIISVFLSEILSAFLFSQFIDKLDFLNKESFFYRIISIELTNIILFLLVMLLSFFVKKKHYSISFRYWIMLLSVPVTTLITLTVYQYYMSQLPPGEEMNIYIIVSSLGLVFINVLVFVLFSKLQSQLDLLRHEELMRMQMELEKNSFNKLEDSYNRTRALRHDLKNHLKVLSGMAKSGTREELLEYLDTMVDTVEESTYVSVCGNSAVDAVLNEKLATAQKNNIASHFDVCKLTDTKIPPMDLCVIIGNALDNAIEAAVKIPDIEKRYIHLKITSGDGELFISAENPVLTAPKKRGKLYVSDKGDSEAHGLGLKSIKRTVDKYSGEMMLKCDNNVFNFLVDIKEPGEK